MKLSKEYIEEHGIEIEAAVMHMNVVIPGLGTYDRTLSPAKIKGATFYLLPQGYLINLDDKQYMITTTGCALLKSDKKTKSVKS